MAANFTDEEFAKQLQSEFDRENADYQKKDLKNTLDRFSKQHNVSDTDSDSTVEPDPADWDRVLSRSPDKNRKKEDKSVHKVSQDKTSKQQLLKRRSYVHEMSDSEEDDCNMSANNVSKERLKVSSVKGKSPLAKAGQSQVLKNKKQEIGEFTKQDRIPSPHALKRKATEILDEEASSSGSSSKPMCKYGSKCYRKNPSHLKEFFHPENGSSASNHNQSANSPPLKKKRSSTPPTKRVQSTASAGSSSPVDVYKSGQPYSFFLTKVKGIKEVYNASYTMGIKDILSESMGNLVASCQFNYMFEIEWLIKQYPEKFRSKPILLVHGFQGPSKAGLEADGLKYSNIKFCQARLDMPYGTHHTKMMLLLYDNGLRVVIHTSNLIERDWFQKTQGMWISPLFPKLVKSSSTEGDSPTRFKHDLLEYVSSYRAYQLKDWKDHICQHDMSSARVFIIGSTPGRHAADKKSCYGHMKLRKVLHDHGPEKDQVKGWPVIGQFSSVGSLGPNKENWLCAEWLQSLATVKGTSVVPLAATKLQLIFPTKDNVRCSLEGYPAGASIPYSIHVAKKQQYLHTFMCKWKSDGRGRSRAMPHIKTFGRPSPSGEEVAWYIVTSANLSKAAWGALEKKASQLMIRSYEIGVLFLPKFYGKKTLKTSSSVCNMDSSDDVLVLPYDLPATPHEKTDRPWIWDIAYKELPDSNGNMWCPS